LYHRIYNLPGGMEPNGQLRRCLAHLSREYPTSMKNVMESFQRCLDEERLLPQAAPYEGDLEKDFLRSLSEIQRSAEEKPIYVEIDFRN
jgi:hypothetical protein